MFENPDFEVDKQAEEYRLLTPVLSRLNKSKSKPHKAEVEEMEVSFYIIFLCNAPILFDRSTLFRNIRVLSNVFQLFFIRREIYIEITMPNNRQVQQEKEKDSDDEVFGSSDESESSDEDRTWKEVKKQHKIIRRNQEHEDNDGQSKEREQVYELNEAPKVRGNIKSITRVSKASLGERLAREPSTVVSGTGGNREMKFTMRGKRSESDAQKKIKKHYQERKQIVRKTGFLAKKRPSRR